MALGRKGILIGLMLSVLGSVSAVAKNDDYVGYYYPEPARVEVYKARAQTMPNLERHHRIGFVIGIAKQLTEQPYPAQIAAFAKGEGATKLIIVSQVEGRLNTLYRVRAYLAMLTASARLSPIFQKMNVEDRYTFLDLAKMLGFESVTVSDGHVFAYQVHIR